MECFMNKLFLPILIAMAFTANILCHIQTQSISTTASQDVVSLPNDTTNVARGLTKKIVYTFDHDDVINTKNKLGFFDYTKYIPVIAKVAWTNPAGAARLIWNWNHIKTRGKQVAQRIQGTSNIMYALAQELKNEGYADLTPYVEEMTAITVKPTPIWQTINYIKELKQKGYTVIGATNQDYYQNKYFRERMAAQGVRFNELFDAVLVAHTKIKAEELPKTLELVHLLEPGIYMPSSGKGTKPHTDYFYALKEVSKRHAPHAKVFIHTDDKPENIQGAQKTRGFSKALLFKLPSGKSARKCTPEELQATFDEWKKSLEKLK